MTDLTHHGDAELAPGLVDLAVNVRHGPNGSASARLSTVDLPGGASEIVIAVGPEGGIADDELVAFVAAGAVPVRLGPTVLRTSTAGVAALAILSARLGRW